MDLSKLKTGEKIALWSGALLLLNIFLPWYRGGDFFKVGVGADAFASGFLAWFGSLCAVGAAAIIYMKLTGKIKAANAVTMNYLALALAVVAFVLILVQLILNHDSLFIGVFVGLLASLALVAGAFLSAGFAVPGQGKPAAGEVPPPPPPPA